LGCRSVQLSRHAESTVQWRSRTNRRIHGTRGLVVGWNSRPSQGQVGKMIALGVFALVIVLGELGASTSTDPKAPYASMAPLDQNTQLPAVTRRIYSTRNLPLPIRNSVRGLSLLLRRSVDHRYRNRLGMDI
jgi:hypothetical protein